MANSQVFDLSVPSLNLAMLNFMQSVKTLTSVTTSTSRRTSTIHVTITSLVSGCTPLPRRGLDEDLKLAAIQESEIEAREEGAIVERTYEERIGKVMRNVLGN